MNKSITITPAGEIYVLHRDESGALRSISRSFNMKLSRTKTYTVRIWDRARYRGRLSKRAEQVLRQLGYDDPKKLLDPS